MEIKFKRSNEIIKKITVNENQITANVCIVNSWLADYLRFVSKKSTKKKYQNQLKLRMQIHANANAHDIPATEDAILIPALLWGNILWKDNSGCRKFN